MTRDKRDQELRLREYRDAVGERECIIQTIKQESKALNSFKPYLVAFLEKYPFKNPQAVISEFENVKQGASLLVESLSSMEFKLKNELSNTVKLEASYSEQIKVQTKQINELTSNNAKIQDIHDAEVKDFNSKLNEMLRYKKENMELRSYLFSIYSKIVEYSNLDIEFKPKLSMIEQDDFNVSFFSNAEVVNYLYSALHMTNSVRTIEFHREILAYCNVILRKFLKDENINKFDPERILKELYRLVNEWSQREKEAKAMKKKHMIDNQEMQAKMRKMKLAMQRSDQALYDLRNKCARLIEEKTEQANFRKTNNIKTSSFPKFLHVSKFELEILSFKNTRVTTKYEITAISGVRKHATVESTEKSKGIVTNRSNFRNEVANFVSHTNRLFSGKQKQREASVNARMLLGKKLKVK